MWRLVSLVVVGAILCPHGACGQSLLELPAEPSTGEQGGFGPIDPEELFWFIVAFVETAFLTATIAYHPRVSRGPASRAASELPKTLFTYALVGMICGFLVNSYGATIGFVIFGIGSLMRFRTTLDSSKSTGRVILAALIGLCVGLRMPYVAVLSTASAWIIIYFLERDTLATLIVHFGDQQEMIGAFSAYREAIAQSGCSVLRSRQSATKPQCEFTLNIPQRLTQDDVERAIERGLSQGCVGEMHWEAK